MRSRNLRFKVYEKCLVLHMKLYDVDLVTFGVKSNWSINGRLESGTPGVVLRRVGLLSFFANKERQTKEERQMKGKDTSIRYREVVPSSSTKSSLPI